MAVYYDQFYANSKLNGSQDPTQELYTFLSYKLTDWCTKVGPDYAEMVDNHTNLFAKPATYYDSNTDYCYLTVRLKGPGSRSGAVNDISQAQGFRFYFFSSNTYLYTWKGLPTFLNTGTYGQTSVVREYLVDSTSSYTASTTDYSNPRLTRVMYGDTPGNRFFAWILNDRDIGPLVGYVGEVTPRPYVPAEEDLGWAMIYSSSFYHTGINQTYYNDGADTYPFKSGTNTQWPIINFSYSLLADYDGRSYTGVPYFTHGKNILIGAPAQALTRIQTPYGYYSNWYNRLWIKEADL